MYPKQAFWGINGRETYPSLLRFDNKKTEIYQLFN